MPQTLRAPTDADFLAALPAIAGMRLERSLVIVALRGGRTGEAIRLDLPADRGARALRGTADACVALAVRCPGADGVSIVVVTDSSFEAERGIPWHELVREVAVRMRRAGLRVVSRLCLAADGWGCYDARGDRGPWPLDEVAAAPILAELPPAVDLESPEAWARLPEAEPEVSVEVGELVTGLTTMLEGSVATSGAEGWRAAEALYDAVEETLGTASAEDVPASRLAMLVAAANVPAWRDAVTLWIAFGTDVECDELGELFMGATRGRPSVQRCRRGILALLRAAANADEPRRPGPLCAAAWLSWALGRSSAAGILLDEALRIAPGHGMSELLQALIGSGRLPEWAFDDASEHQDC